MKKENNLQLLLTSFMQMIGIDSTDIELDFNRVVLGYASFLDIALSEEEISSFLDSLNFCVFSFRYFLKQYFDVTEVRGDVLVKSLEAHYQKMVSKNPENDSLSDMVLSFTCANQARLEKNGLTDKFLPLSVMMSENAYYVEKIYHPDEKAKEKVNS